MAEYQFRVDLRARYEGQYLVNTFHYYSDSDESEENLIEFIRANMITEPLFFIRRCCCLTAEWYEIRIGRLNTNRLNRWSVSVPISAAGVWDNLGMPPQVCAVVKRRAALSSRRFRGRIFVGALPRFGCIGGLIDTTQEIWNRLDAVRVVLVAPLGTLLGRERPRPLMAPILVNYQDTRERPFGLYGYAVAAVSQRSVPLRTHRRRQLGHGRSG